MKGIFSSKKEHSRYYIPFKIEEKDLKLYYRGNICFFVK